MMVTILLIGLISKINLMMMMMAMMMMLMTMLIIGKTCSSPLPVFLLCYSCKYHHNQYDHYDRDDHDDHDDGDNDDDEDEGDSDLSLLLRLPLSPSQGKLAWVLLTLAHPKLTLTSFILFVLSVFCFCLNYDISNLIIHSYQIKYV